MAEKKRAKDFRYVFASTFGARASDNDIAVVVGIDEGDTPGEIIEEQVGIIMTPRSAKLLHHILGQVLDRIEKATGDISIAPDKLEQISRDLRGAATNLPASPKKSKSK